MRPNWCSIHFAQALLISTRATCPRLHAGVVIVDEDHQIRAHGYNGSLKGQPHCEDVGCLMVDGHCLRTIHSEENALVFAGKRGQNVIDCTAYVTARPCQKCTKLMIQSGIKDIRFWLPYNTDAKGDQVEEMTRAANVALTGPYCRSYPLEQLFNIERMTQ